VSEDGTKPTTAKARNAATVMLLRDAAQGPEVFMMERHQRSHFVAGAYVFPGGGVDPDDTEAEGHCVGLDDAAASERLHLESGGLAFYVAAIRECFEEAGVLLAYDEAGKLLDLGSHAYATHVAELRDALNAGKVGFVDLVRQEGWRLATDHMHYWAHWITPEQSPVRYDTRFFLATAPSEQTAVHDDGELTHSAWVTPAEALSRAESGQWTIIFPTLRNLETVRDFGSVAEAEQAGRRRRDIPTQQPLIVRREGGIQAVLPGDEGYEQAVAEAKRQAAGEEGAR
jgi:8-oxo-dGTP pyrophosphatase MutT (NUDIX family)